MLGRRGIRRQREQRCDRADAKSELMRQAPKSKAKCDGKRRFSQAVQRETPPVAALISPCRQCRHTLSKSLLVLLFTVTCACRGDAKRRLSYQDKHTSRLQGIINDFLARLRDVNYLIN